MRWPAARLALLAVLSLPAAVSAAPPAADSFTVDGHAMTASLVAVSSRVIVGEPVLLQLHVANASDDQLYVVGSPDREAPPDGFTVTVTGPSGPIPMIPAGGLAGNGMSGPVSIAPHTAHISRLMLSDWAKVDQPGRYTITVAKTLRLGLGRGDDWRTRPTRHPIQLFVTLDVATGTIAELGAVIARLGSQMLAGADDGGYSAAQALATIPDPRAEPYFIKALSFEWSRQFIAICALAHFHTPASLAALERTMATPGIPGYVRITAAQSIAAHNSDASMKILWPLHTDPDPSLRLEIVHAVAKLDASDAVDRLTEMSRDASAMVSGEAKRYLARRGK